MQDIFKNSIFLISYYYYSNNSSYLVCPKVNRYKESILINLPSNPHIDYLSFCQLSFLLYVQDHKVCKVLKENI